MHRRRPGRHRAEQEVPLDLLEPEHSGQILALSGDPALQSRLRSMGFMEGERVCVVKQAPLADPVEYRIRRMHVSLRRQEARQILVCDVRADVGGGRGRRMRCRGRAQGRSRMGRGPIGRPGREGCGSRGGGPAGIRGRHHGGAADGFGSRIRRRLGRWLRRS
jgi:Fe2+ transport system protein FeoA